MTAASYLTNPAIGREAELDDLELILISPKKSPILLGEAGVGQDRRGRGVWPGSYSRAKYRNF